MQRGVIVFASVLAGVLACGAFGEGGGASPGTSDAGDAGGADGSSGGVIPDGAPAEAAPPDGNPCASRAARLSATNFFARASVDGFDPPQMTVEAWIFVPAAAATKTMHLVSHVPSDRNSGWALAVVPGPNLAFFSYTSGAQNTLGGSGAQSAIDKDRWVHVAVTRDQAKVQLVIDGKTTAPFSDSFKFGTGTSGGLTIGARTYDGLESFDGLVEEVRISKVVRTVSIARTGMLSDDDTLALWRFDEQGGDALDSSPNDVQLGEEGEVPRICMPRFADDDVTP